MNYVAKEEDTDNERHDRRDGGNACSRDGAKLFNDVVVNDVSQTRPAQSQTNDQTYPGARIVKHDSNSMETGHEEEEDHGEPDLVCRQSHAGSFSGVMNLRA